MSDNYLNQLTEGKTDIQKKVYEGYLNGLQTLIGADTGKPLLEFSEEDIYNRIINGTTIKNDNVKPLAKYMKTAYINLCILLREKNGLTTEFLRNHTKRRK
jgi:hypothetical protein